MLQAHQKIFLRPFRAINIYGKAWDNINVVRMQSSNDPWYSWVVHLHLVKRIGRR